MPGFKNNHSMRSDIRQSNPRATTACKRRTVGVVENPTVIEPLQTDRYRANADRAEFLDTVLPQSHSSVFSIARMAGQQGRTRTVAFDPQVGSARVHNLWDPHPNLQTDIRTRTGLMPDGRKAEVFNSSRHPNDMARLRSIGELSERQKHQIQGGHITGKIPKVSTDSTTGQRTTTNPFTHVAKSFYNTVRNTARIGYRLLNQVQASVTPPLLQHRHNMDHFGVAASPLHMPQTRAFHHQAERPKNRELRAVDATHNAPRVALRGEVYEQQTATDQVSQSAFFANDCSLGRNVRQPPCQLAASSLREGFGTSSTSTNQFVISCKPGVSTTAFVDRLLGSYQGIHENNIDRYRQPNPVTVVTRPHVGQVSGTIDQIPLTSHAGVPIQNRPIQNKTQHSIHAPANANTRVTAHVTAVRLTEAGDPLSCTPTPFRRSQGMNGQKPPTGMSRQTTVAANTTETVLTGRTSNQKPPTGVPGQTNVATTATETVFPSRTPDSEKPPTGVPGQTNVAATTTETALTHTQNGVRQAKLRWQETISLSATAPDTRNAPEDRKNEDIGPGILVSREPQSAHTLTVDGRNAATPSDARHGLLNVSQPRSAQTIGNNDCNTPTNAPITTVKTTTTTSQVSTRATEAAPSVVLTPGVTTTGLYDPARHTSAGVAHGGVMSNGNGERMGYMHTMGANKESKSMQSIPTLNNNSLIVNKEKKRLSDKEKKSFVNPSTGCNSGPDRTAKITKQTSLPSRTAAIPTTAVHDSSDERRSTAKSRVPKRGPMDQWNRSEQIRKKRRLLAPTSSFLKK